MEVTALWTWEVQRLVKRWQIFLGKRDLEDDVDDDVEAGGDDEGDGEDGLVAPPHLEDQGDQIRKIIY